MRLVIDLQGAQSESRLRGIGRYSVDLVEAMARIKGDHEIIVALNDAFPETLVPLRARLEPVIGPGNVRVWSAPVPVRGADPADVARRTRAEAVYEAFLASLDPDLILISSLFEGYGADVVTSIGSLDLRVPIAVILYDFIPLHDGQALEFTQNPLRERFYRRKLSAASRADLLLAISEFSATDAAHYLEPDCKDRRIANISTACSDVFKPSAMPAEGRARLRARLGIDRQFLITSGTVEPRKNLATLLRAFALLPVALRTRYQIVVIGHATENQTRTFRTMCADAGVPQEALVVTGYISDEDLVALYSDADLMVFPSLDEGFGLPPLEAMSCGTPTIGSNASSIPEVIGLADALFDPRDAGAIAALVRRGLEDEEFRARLKANAALRAAAFSWEKTAQKALTAMTELVVAQTLPEAHRPLPLEACLDAVAATAMTDPERADLCQALAFDFPPPGRKPHLFVDVSQLRVNDGRTGIQRVTRSVLQAWLETPPDGFRILPVYATNDRLGYVSAHHFLSRLTGNPSSEVDAPIDYAAGDVFFGLDLQPQIIASQKPYLQQMRRRGVRTRFLVYDLLPVQLPDFFPELTSAYFERWLEVIAASDGIVGISQATVDAFCAWQEKRGLVNQGPFSHGHVHLGADIENSLPTTGLSESAKAVLDRITGSNSFLCVGTIEPRKGYAQVLDAFETLWARGVDVTLVVVGHEGWKVKALVQRMQNHPESGKRFFWLAGISDEYLARVYAEATCLLAASQGEGFGLPLIEAAQAALPILARDIGVFREIAGPNATYFDADTPEQLGLAIQSWLSSFHDGRAPASEALKWLTWAECAAELGQIATMPSVFKPVAKD